MATTRTNIEIGEFDESFGSRLSPVARGEWSPTILDFIVGEDHEESPGRS